MSCLHCTYAFNAGFVRQSLISIYSLLAVTKDKIKIAIHTDGVCPELTAGLDQLGKLFPRATFDHRVHDDLPQQDHPHIRNERAFSHWAMSALAKTQVKTLFVDGDTVFTDDPAELFNIDMAGKLILGCKDTPYEILATKVLFWEGLGAIGRGPAARLRQRLNRGKTGITFETYVNSGILLVDMPAIRAEHLQHKLDDFADYHATGTRHDWSNNDQDWFNHLFGTRMQRIGTVSPRWNLLANLANPDRFWSIAVSTSMRRRYRDARRDPAIYHFAGGSFKPWQTKPLRRPMTPLQKQALGAWYAAAESYRSKTGQALPPMQEKIQQTAEKMRGPWDCLFS